MRNGLFLLLAALVIGLAAPDKASSGSDELRVEDDPGGGLHAAAVLTLPVPPAVVQAVLTDYERWPVLFGVQMRIGRIERRPDHVLTDLYIRHPILPGERRLMCENRVPPGGGLVTTLVEGDFRRYARTWRLAEDGDPGRTKARFNLVVDVKTLAPDWMVSIELQRQLEKHFRILREMAAEQAARQAAGK